MKKRFHSIYSHNVKKHQRLMNRAMRKMNKDIEKDELWKGRFIVRQVWRQFETYEDKSGSVLHVWLKLIDKKTGLVKELRPDTVNHFVVWGHLWWEMNNFIVHDSHVWDDINEVKNDPTDWSKVEYNEDLSS